MNLHRRCTQKKKQYKRDLNDISNVIFYRRSLFSFTGVKEYYSYNSIIRTTVKRATSVYKWKKNERCNLSLCSDNLYKFAVLDFIHLTEFISIIYHALLINTREILRTRSWMRNIIYQWIEILTTFSRKIIDSSIDRNTSLYDSTDYKTIWKLSGISSLYK